MLPITKCVPTTIFLVLLFAAQAWAMQPANDDCFSADTVLISQNPCNLLYVEGTNEFATDSSPSSGEPSSTCGRTYDGGDVWFRVNEIPGSGKLLIKVKSDSQLDLVVEAYYGSCENQLNPVGCTDFQQESFLLLTDLPAGFPLFIRVWDNQNNAVGRFELAVQYVGELENLELCDEFGGRYPANQFIVSFEEGAGEAEISDLMQFLIDYGFDEGKMKECDCGPEYMQLWTINTNDVALLDDARKGSRQKAGVDTTEYNYSITDFFINPLDETAEPREPGYAPGEVESSVKVAIIDSGVAHEHSALQEALWKNEDQSEDCVAGVEIGYDFTKPDPLPTDIDGHGTAVNGIFLLNYPSNIRLELMNMKFYEGTGYVFDAVCAMHFAMNKQARILNLSWGFYRERIPYILDRALWRTYKEDLLVVTSAGNDTLDNDTHIRWPANSPYEHVVTVGAAAVTPPDTTMAYYSNYGEQTVDLFANGYFNTLAPPNGSTTVAGTSLSAPFVARTASIIRARYPELSAPDVRLCLLKFARVLPALAGTSLTEGMLYEPDALQCADELANPLSTAAVQLRGEVVERKVQLHWQIYQERPIDTYYIQHSLDGKNWTNIGVATTDLTFTDVHPPIGQNYYRLQWTTEEGDRQESNVVAFTIQAHLRLFPNPVRGEHVILELEDGQSVEHATLFNAAGREIRHWSLAPSQTQYQLSLSDLPKGVYILRLKTGQQFMHQRLVIFGE